MNFCTIATELDETRRAVDALAVQLRATFSDGPDFLLVAYSESHDPAVVRAGLMAHFPDALLLGSSTCRGVMTQDGLMGFGKPVISLAAFADPESAFGTASLVVEGDIAAAVDRAIESAQAAANRLGEVPDMIWLHASPGAEEVIIAAIQRVLGAHVLISGGSSADEAIAGKWSQFDTDGVAQGAALALIYADLPITHHFQSGYLPTDCAGTATRAQGRVLYEIDGQPAAQVYNDWTGGAIAAALADRGVNILQASSWHPLGKSIGRIGPSPDLMVDCYCLVHPDSVGPDGALRLFANVEEGSRIVLMKSGRDELIKRATQVVRTSLEMAPKDKAVTGALMVFCAGCMLSLGDDIALAAKDIRTAYGKVPFMGIFTFGEQGSFLNGERLHGNLMISSSLFSGSAVAD